MSRNHRGLPVVFAAALLLAAVGCQIVPQQKIAREEANKRWNRTRSDIKARLANDELSNGRVPAAEVHLEEALKLNPDDASLKILEARVLLARGGTAEAEQALNVAQRLNGSSAEIFYLRGVIAQQRMDWEDAIANFDASAEKDPEDVAAFAAAAQTRIQVGRAAEAIGKLDAARRRLAWKPGFHAACAECYEALNKWIDAADAWRLVATATNDGEVRARYANALLRAERWTDAISTIRACMEERSTVPAIELRLGLAEASLHVDDAATAREELAFVMRDKADDPRAMRLMAVALSMQGDGERALQLAERCAKSSPRLDIESAELAASIAWRGGNSKRAREWAIAIQQAPGQRDNPVAAKILNFSQALAQ